MTMLVWPFCPQTKMIEVLEWGTHVNRAYSAEQRLCKRPIPRITYQHQYVLDRATYGAAAALARQIGDDACYVPDWPNHVPTVPMDIGTVTLPIDADLMPAYKAGGHVLLWENNLSYEVCAVQVVGASTITIAATTMAHAAPIACPLREGFFSEHLASDREGSSSKVRASCAFDVVVTENLTDVEAGIVYPLYCGVPIITDPVEIINGARDSLAREAAVLDEPSGGVARTPLHATSTRSFAIAWNRLSLASLWSLRRFLHARKGRFKNFWLPSQNGDFTVTSNITGGDEYIRVTSVGAVTHYAFPFDLMIFAAELDGGWPVRVTGAAYEEGGHDLLLLAVPFSGSVDVSAIGRTDVLTLSRFDSDRLEIQYRAGLASSVVAPTTEDPNIPELPS